MPRKMWVLFPVLLIFVIADARADNSCAVADHACLIKELDQLTAGIPEDTWRDQTWRETAKLMATAGMLDDAVAIIPKIKTPDTRAMTIRGIGMAAADLNLPKEKLDGLFTKLKAEAEKIDHAPSHAIALTYIGMAQAFAGDDEAAMTTSASMTNASLRNKAYGETAEIQAERNDLEAVLKSLAAIDDTGYKDKEMGLIVKIFVNEGNYANALEIAKLIGNTYQKSQALLYILTKQMNHASADQKRDETP